MNPFHSLDFLSRLGGAWVATNLEGMILYWSRDAQRLLGFSSDEVKLKNWWEFFPTATREQIKSALTEPSRSATFAGASTIQDKRGTVMPVIVWVSPLLDESDSPRVILTTCHPLQEGAGSVKADSPARASREEAQSREEVYQARKAQEIGALAAGLSHDFNNILTAIMVHLDLLMAAPSLPADLRNHATPARKSATRMAELVARLLTFSQQSRPVLTSLQLPLLFDEVMAALRRSVDANIEIRPMSATPDLWSIHADQNQVMQVITNLGLSGRDAMPKGGTLSFELANVTFDENQAKPPRRAGEFVRLTVGDTGRGISPQMLERMFKPNFMTREFGKGVGLGLSIANSIVSEHGGWMEVESEIGQGSRFHAYFPRLQNAPPRSEAPRDLLATNNASLEGKETILLADDEEMVRLVARAILGYRGYTIIEAVDGEDAVRKYCETPARFDLVLMDLQMPNLSGPEALARLREINPKVKVLLLGGSSREFVEQARKLDATILVKPFDNVDLLRQVRTVLDQRVIEKE